MQGVFDRAVVNQIQQASDIVEVVSEHVNLVKKGRELVGLCPFHDDHQPSMYVNPAKQIFKCFACGAGGDVFKFLQMRENLTFPQAIERLAQRTGIKVKPLKTTKSQRPSDDIDPVRLAKVNQWAAEYFHKNLTDEQKGKKTREYIAERKITPGSIKTWRLGLGVSGDDLVKTARARNVRMELLQKAGLVLNTADGGFRDKFVNRLMFPIADVTGRVIGFGGRTLEGDDAKYINSPTTALFDKSNCLYGLEQARHRIVSTATAVVVEGYTDCIMAHQFDCCNVVATLGTSFTAGHARILRRYAKKVVLLFDSDVAGSEAANRALDVCLSSRMDIKLASVSEGKDPCDFLVTAGKKKFDELVDSATDVFEFKWNRLTESFSNNDTLVDHKTAVEEFLQTIAASVRSGNLSAIDRGLLVNRLSRLIGLDSRQVNAELNQRVLRGARTASFNRKNQKVCNVDLGQGLFAAAQREILEVLLNEPALFEIVKKEVTAESFDVPILRQIAQVLFEMLSNKKDVELSEILAAIESVETGSAVVQLAQSGADKGNFSSRLAGAMDSVLRCQMQKKTSQLKAVDDQNQFLQRICENIRKENPHNLGMF